MKRSRIVLVSLALLGLTITILLMNRSRMKAAARNEEVRFLPVTLVQAERMPLDEHLSLTGTIAGFNDVPVIAETQGKVTRIFASVGDEVRAGQPLVQVDDELKHANYQAATVNFEKAKRDYERYQSLIKDSTISDAQLEASRLTFKSAEAQYIIARRQYEDATVKSPIAGVVTARPVDIGMMVQNNSMVAEVVDISRLKVNLRVAEEDVFKMKVSDSVAVATDVYPGVTFRGKISTISDKADDGHTYAVEAELPNSARHPLKAGMFGRVSFVAIGPTESLSVPRRALVGSIRTPQVFVVENNIAHLRSIVVGGEYDSRLQILSGLNAGEQVVASGQNNLKDGVAVTVVQ